jgi:hypothetical protein
MLISFKKVESLQPYMSHQVSLNPYGMSNGRLLPAQLNPKKKTLQNRKRKYLAYNS